MEKEIIIKLVNRNKVKHALTLTITKTKFVVHDYNIISNIVQILNGIH